VDPDPFDPASDLLERFRSGDEEAFRALFDRHVALLERSVGERFPGWLNRRLAVSDVIQETRLVAFARRADFEDRGPDAFRNWVLGIAAMKLREAVRRHGKVARRAAWHEVTRGHGIDVGAAPAGGPSPSQAAASLETVVRVREALERLPEDYREAIRLVREEGVPLAEAAERMGRSPEAVRKLLGRALCRLKEVFDELGGSGRGG
jgi:RNA polymerase sigma-70 factor (ECF subfamily)